MKKLLKIACLLAVGILLFNGCTSQSTDNDVPTKYGSEFFDERDKPENIAFLVAQQNETEPAETYMREIPSDFYGSSIPEGAAIEKEVEKMMQEQVEITGKFYDFFRSALSNMSLQVTKEKPNEKSEFFTLTNKESNKYIQLYENNQIRFFEKGQLGTYWELKDEDMKLLKSIIEFYKENLTKLHEYQLKHLKTLEGKE